ncbi:hypothetical protein HGG64_00475 [Mycoplasma phocoeninasale]|uniref:Uncharacterized protein n=1 Tax=Mycoplasma phocoeninasale TaxID=2726117 RepID=A0A858U5W6_9MOLU|nr:hypothetical protein [Mycoplasma phocoeninasale]QJG66198.1 hypothetical protein HGG64_00475 [Mycoplasma phocoeninasale]
MITNRLGKNYLLKISSGDKIVDPFSFDIISVKPIYTFENSLEMAISDNLTFVDLAHFIDSIFGLKKLKSESWFSIGKQKIVLFDKNITFSDYGSYSFIYEYESLILYLKFLSEGTIADFRYNILLKNGNIGSLNITVNNLNENVKKFYSEIFPKLLESNAKFLEKNLKLESKYGETLLEKFNITKVDLPEKLPKIAKFEHFENFTQNVKNHLTGDLSFPIELRDKLGDKLWIKDLNDAEIFSEIYQKPETNKAKKEDEYENVFSESSMFGDKNIFEDPMGSLEKMVKDLYDAAKSMGINDSEMEEYFKKTFEEFKSFTLPSFETPINMEKSLMDALHKVMGKKSQPTKAKSEPEINVAIKKEAKKPEKITTKTEETDPEIN